jgi:hypothetical protein
MITGAAPAGIPSDSGSAAAQPNAATAPSQTDGGEAGEQSGAQRTFSQQELDEIVRKRVAKAEAKAERRVLRTLEQVIPRQPVQTQQASQPANDGKPARAHFASDEAYVDALTDWKLEQREQRATAERQQAEHQKLAKKTESIYEEAQKLPGFDRDAFDDLPLTKPIVEALIDSEAPAKLMHYLAANPEEVDRIAALSPARQAAELGKLEAKALAAKPPPRSNAPQALSPIKGGSASGAPSPKDSAAWIRYQNERERARMQGK